MKNIRRLLRFDIPLHFVLVLTNWWPDMVVLLRLRGFFASLFIGNCGKDLRLGRNVTFYNPQKISIGNHVYIAYGSWFSASETISIGDEVVVGPYNVFASSNHTKMGNSFRYGIPKKAPIFVNNGTWIGAQCTILAGVSIGEGVLVAANSVVVDKIDNHKLVAGTPARIIKDI